MCNTSSSPPLSPHTISRALSLVSVPQRKRYWRGGRRERTSATARSAEVLSQIGHTTAGRMLGRGMEKTVHFFSYKF